METHKKFHIERNALRFYVFATGIGMTVYCALLCFGMRHFVAELLCVVGAYALLCGGAWMFKLCWLSWAFIIYSFLIRVCIMLYAEGFFDGEWRGHSVLEIAHVAAFGIGAVLCMIFVVNIKRFLSIMRNENEKC